MMRVKAFDTSAISLVLTTLLLGGCISVATLAQATYAWGDESTTESTDNMTSNDTPNDKPNKEESPDSPAPSPKPEWLLKEDGWYYIGPDGEPCTGWQLVQGDWYWLDPAQQGRMSTGLFVDETGGTYFSNDKGVMQKNCWAQWQLVQGDWYWLDPAQQGRMSTGLFVDETGGTYFSNDKGVMQKNCWAQSGGAWYWLSSSGSTKSGWLSNKGSWYWLDPAKQGRMATGWLQEGKTWYYLTGSGAMATGWRRGGCRRARPGTTSPARAPWRRERASLTARSTTLTATAPGGALTKQQSYSQNGLNLNPALPTGLFS